MDITITLTKTEIAAVKQFRDEQDTFDFGDITDNLWEIFESLADAVEYADSQNK